MSGTIAVSSLPENLSFLSSLPEDTFFNPSKILIPPQDTQPHSLVLPGLPARVYRLFNKIFNLCWKYSGKCRASYSFLADGLDVSESSIQRYLNLLVANALIGKRQHFEAPNTYYLKLNQQILLAALQAGYSINVDELKKLILKQKPDFQFDQNLNQQGTDSSQHQIQCNLLLPVINEQLSNLTACFVDFVKNTSSMFQTLQSDIASIKNILGQIIETQSQAEKKEEDDQREQ